MYLGLNFIVRIRNPSVNAFLKAIVASAKSAAFLGSFVGSFWYAICLTRTRLGPYILPNVDPIHLDNYCVRVGSLACGWSILIESVHRRVEVGVFVAPKALATFFPRTYGREVSVPYVFPKVTANCGDCAASLDRNLGFCIEQWDSLYYPERKA